MQADPRDARQFAARAVVEVVHGTNLTRSKVMDPARHAA